MLISFTGIHLLIPILKYRFHLFHCFFSYSVNFPFSLPSDSLYSFFSLVPLSAAVMDFFLPCLKYEYFRAKELKGNNEMAPMFNYSPFLESYKKDSFERTGATKVFFLFLRIQMGFYSPCFYSMLGIFHQILPL